MMTILTRVELAGRSLVRKYLPRKSTLDMDYDPYNKEECEYLASTLLDEMHNDPGRGTLETCQRILAIIGVSYPTEKLAAEYFSNLETLLSSMPRLENPGQLVIGLGPGRCGSTSLSAMLGSVTNSCCTHETPPLLFWNPQSDQVDFHIKRFQMLANSYSLVADVSHWWLNSIERVFDQIPEAKAIGLIRDPDDCAMSFMRIQGFGKGSYNPWVSPGNGLWCSGHWDPTYPSYSPPSYAGKNPDRAKLELITRYVKEYNARLEEIARNAPDRVKLLHTEELGIDLVQEKIFQIAKARGQISTWKLNVKGTVDGIKTQIKF
jgi:hypothetical protein